MKRIILCLSIAALSVTGVYAQDKGAQSTQNEKDLKVYKQEQEQLMQKAIQSQEQHYIMEATKTRDSKIREAQQDLESRRAQLLHRPEKMAPYRGN